MSKFNDLQDKIEEINSEYGMLLYQIALIVDVCEMLLIETNLEKITDNIFDEVKTIVENYNYTSDDFMSDVWDIMTELCDTTTENIELSYE